MVTWIPHSCNFHSLCLMVKLIRKQINEKNAPIVLRSNRIQRNVDC